MNELERDLKAVLDCREVGYPLQDIPEASFSAAVLVLFRGARFGAAELLLTKRAHHVATHAGQVAFPGGGAEDQDLGSFHETALREAREEVGIESARIRTVGGLPALPTVTGGFRVVPVLALWTGEPRAPRLNLDAREVEHAGWVGVSDLRLTRREEVRLVRGRELPLPEFRWGDERMWGLTALIFDLILRRYDRIRL